jgi:hypothetical protein
MFSGTAPSFNTTSWKARMSNLSPSSSFGVLAQVLDLDHADLVGRRLARHHDVALDLASGPVAFGDGRIVQEVLDGLFLGPAFGVDAGIDDEADGAPDLQPRRPKSE